MKIPAHHLRNELTQLTQQLLSEAESFQTLTLAQLNWRKTPASWSILECLEHLNRYGNFYLPEIEARIHKGKPAVTLDSTFRSGWLGDYFANLMRSTKKSNRMKTFSSMNPLGSTLDLTVLDEFIRQQQQLVRLLTKAQQVDLTRTRTSISLSRFITLRLGDTFRFVIYHNQRHINQAKRALAAQKQTERIIF
jgi:hypothetical protein